MAAPPSLKDIEAVYRTTEPKLIYVNHAAVRIRDGGSDGDESRLPEAGEQVVLWDNTINVLEEADAETVRHWLGKIGNYLIHEGRGQWHNLREDRVYFLKRFPPGYKLYTRSTGPRENPRKDSYLYGMPLTQNTLILSPDIALVLGSTTDRCREFRSPEEFVLHVKWMAFGKPKDERGRPLCACCYCSRRSQGEISPILRRTISHLPHQSSNRASGSGHATARSHAPEGPIMAKDYTHLHEGEGVDRVLLTREQLKDKDD